LGGAFLVVARFFAGAMILTNPLQIVTYKQENQKEESLVTLSGDDAVDFQSLVLVGRMSDSSMAYKKKVEKDNVCIHSS
jgi:hypothetical protein